MDETPLPEMDLPEIAPNPATGERDTPARGHNGARIRDLRRRKLLTLQGLADAAGISVGFLSQLERDLAAPSLGTLSRLAAALGVEVDFFIATPKNANVVTRNGERLRFSPADTGLSYERLTTSLPGGVLSSVIIILPTGYHTETSRDFGEEMLFVLHGEIEQRLGAEIYRLKTGDSLHFDGETPHSTRNIGTGTAQVLWTGTRPALFG